MSKKAQAVRGNLGSHIIVVLAVFIWGSAFVVAKSALGDIGPFTLALLRVGIASIVLLPYAGARGFRMNHLRSKSFWVHGLLGYGANVTFLNLGLVTCSAAFSAITSGLLPVLMMILGVVMVSEKVTKRKIFGILLSLSGVTAACVGDLKSGANADVIGLVFLFISVATWAFYSIYVKKYEYNMDAVVSAEIGFFASSICILPFSIGEIALQGICFPGTRAIFELIYLGAVSAALATVLWHRGLKVINPSMAGIYINLIPAVGLFFSLLAGEQITPVQVLGGAMILLGVIIAAGERRV